MNKPTITFYEPYEMILEKNGEISYLDELIITENELVEKYNINYESFLTKDTRDAKGIPIKFTSLSKIHSFILNYLYSLNSV